MCDHILRPTLNLTFVYVCSQKPFHHDNALMSFPDFPHLCPEMGSVLHLQSDERMLGVRTLIAHKFLKARVRSRAAVSE